jgi:hypothetical protein
VLRNWNFQAKNGSVEYSCIWTSLNIFEQDLWTKRVHLADAADRILATP